jgi:superfamily I DNA/RNA helicase
MDSFWDEAVFRGRVAFARATGDAPVRCMLCSREDKSITFCKVCEAWVCADDCELPGWPTHAKWCAKLESLKRVGARVDQNGACVFLEQAKAHRTIKHLAQALAGVAAEIYIEGEADVARKAAGKLKVPAVLRAITAVEAAKANEAAASARADKFEKARAAKKVEAEAARADKLEKCRAAEKVKAEASEADAKAKEFEAEANQAEAKAKKAEKKAKKAANRGGGEAAATKAAKTAAAAAEAAKRAKEAKTDLDAERSKAKEAEAAALPAEKAKAVEAAAAAAAALAAEAEAAALPAARAAMAAAEKAKAADDAKAAAAAAAAAAAEAEASKAAVAAETEKVAEARKAATMKEREVHDLLVELRTLSKPVLERAAAHGLVLRAMVLLPRVAGVQQAACGVLEKLASNAMLAALLAAEPHVCVIKAMENHKLDPALLAAEPHVWVIKAMENHKLDPGLQAAALGALRSLSAYAAYREVLTRSMAFSLVGTAMETHKTAALVQENAICVKQILLSATAFDEFMRLKTRQAGLLVAMQGGREDFLGLASRTLYRLAERDSASLALANAQAQLLAAIRRLPGAVNLVRDACGALRLLSPHLGSEGLGGDAWQLLLGVMGTHLSDSEVQTSACAVIAHLARVGGAESVSLAGKGAACVLAAMDLHGADASLEETASGALLALASRDNGINWSQLNALGRLASAMSQHVGAAVLTPACGALGLMAASCGSASEWSRGASRAILGAMPRCVDDAALQQTAIDAVWAIARESGDNRKTLMRLDAPRQIRTAMLRHEHAAAVQGSAWRALGVLALDPDCRELLARSMDAPTLITDAMLRHPDDARLLESAVFALGSLARNAEGQPWTTSCQPLLHVTPAMTRHAADARLQDSACVALGVLFAHHDDDDSAELAFAEASACIVRAMKLHLHDPGVQRSACGALWSLSRRPNPNNLDRLSDGLLQVLRALKGWPADAVLQASGCGALAGVARDPDVKARLGAMTARALVERALREHPGDPAVQEQGLAALRSLLTANAAAAPVARPLVATVTPAATHSEPLAAELPVPVHPPGRPLLVQLMQEVEDAAAAGKPAARPWSELRRMFESKDQSAAAGASSMSGAPADDEGATGARAAGEPRGAEPAPAKRAAIAAAAAATVAAVAAAGSSRAVLLAASALKALVSMDEGTRKHAERKLDELARGHPKSKLLSRGGKNETMVFEVKMSDSMRILYTEPAHRASGQALLVWFFSKHDQVSRDKDSVTRAYRGAAGLAGLLARARPHGDESAVVDPEDLLLDPAGGKALRIYVLGSAQQLSCVAGGWTPPLLLTEREREIVESPAGMCLVHGRAGTGKTLCVATRIARDATLAPHCKQLFVSRTQRLCAHVESLYRASSGGQAEFLPMDTLLEQLEARLAAEGPAEGTEVLRQPQEQRWRAARLVTYAQFVALWPELLKGCRRGAASAPVGVLTVWTQIRSFIKGSHEAALGQRPLSLDEYLNLGARRVTLSDSERRFVYELFVAYSGQLARARRWDCADRVLEAYARVASSSAIRYDFVYSDEVQDMTQAEIALLLQLCERQHQRLFLAGDTAQSISYGVDFRFEEVRSLVHALCDGAAAPKPVALTRNYRSHGGVLDLAAKVIAVLHKNFPHAADVLPRDEGLYPGPHPVVTFADSDEKLAALVRGADRPAVLVLPQDDTEQGVARSSQSCASERRVRAACSKFALAAPLVLDIMESKGLEFGEVILVDFFADIREENQLAWAAMLKPEFVEFFATGKGRGASGLPHELARDLKLLYTAVTRCRSRLTLVETRRSPAGDVMFRLLERWGLATTSEIAASFDLDAATGRQLSPAEWLTTGITLADGAGSDNPVPTLVRARQCFERCGAAQLVLRADAEVAFHDARHQGASKSDKIRAASLCVGSGMWAEATELVRDAGLLNAELARDIVRRIVYLSERA